MDDIDYQAFKQKIDELTLRNKKLESQYKGMQKAIRRYKRIIRDYKREIELLKDKKDKQHYRNGRKRGRTLNG